MNTTVTTVRSVDLEKFLVRVSAIVKALGYVSNSEVKGTDKKSTAMLAFEWADDNKPKEIQAVTFDFADKTTGKDVAEWLGGLMSIPQTNDYMMNLAAIGHVGVVLEKNMGYAASAIKAFEKEKGKSEESQQGLEGMMKTLGAVGSKIFGIQVIFKGKNSFDSKFGLCHKYTFESSVHGYKISWMTGADLPNLTEGSAYVLDGTIKEYSTYKSRHECQVTRAKLR